MRSSRGSRLPPVGVSETRSPVYQTWPTPKQDAARTAAPNGAGPPRNRTTPVAEPGPGLTLAEYAEAKGLPFIVAESPSGQLLGYALVAPWKQKRAYRYTVENSIYLGPAASGKGLGRALLGELIARSKAAGLKEMIAVIADQGAEGSIALHEKFGFVEIRRMGRVGFKFDRWLGTVLLQKTLK